MVSLNYKLPYVFAAISLVKAATIKGIGPEKYALYKPLENGMWTCLDGSKTIPYSAINDDYCDCADGSDEPATSACPNSYFYCTNVGHIPIYIKSSLVNDGICDYSCCDGSDEDGSLITCPNRCKEVGEVYRKEQSELMESIMSGLAAKNKLIAEAVDQIALWEEEKTKLEDELVLKKSEALKLQREFEVLDTHRSSKKRCKAGVIEIATLKHDIVILQKEINTLKSILGDMKRNHNHNFHDLAVKGAISGYDEFIAQYDRIEAEIEADLKSLDATDQDDEEEEEEEADDVEDGKSEKDTIAKEGKEKSIVSVILDKLESIVPDTIKTGVLDKLRPVEQNAVHEEKSSSIGDKKNAALENARKLKESSEEEINRLNEDLDKIKEELAFDYGPEKEWLKLKDVCVERNEGEYTYSLCFFGDAYQKSNKDNTRTHLGRFDRFDTEGDNRYKEHFHNKGTRCWNGPERSVRARIECGSENELLEVSEPEKCEYHYRMLSPAVCESIEEAKNTNKAQSNNNQKNNKKPAHEEL